MDDAPESNYVDAEMVAELRRTAKQAHERGLLAAAHWSLEMLRSLTDERRAKLPPAPEAPEAIELTEEQLCEEETFELARKFVDEKQHARAASLLQDLHSDRAVFLRVYCRYIVGEKKALRDWHLLDGARRQPPTPINPQITELYQSIEDASEPWLLFLKALFLFRLSQINEAIDCVLSSLVALPWNWSAWTLLGDCIHEPSHLAEHLDKLALPSSHPALQLFMVRMMIQLHSATDAEREICDDLLSAPFFPNNLWIMSLRATVLYDLHNYRQAEEQFDQILALEPYRIDSLDVFANILYAVENKEKLSMLAQFFLVLNRDRPEVCYLLGCHYSLRTEHEKSIKYFRRATELDRTFFGAWTLMGMEYLELNNPQAAIESFRRAVDVNPKEYRAWSGLGKAYVMLGMHSYALYYHSRALKLRPDEAECWEDQAHTFELAGRFEEAITCFKRALETSAPNELSVFLRLSQLLDIVGDHPGAAYYAQAAVEHGETRPMKRGGMEDHAKALVAVADHHIRQPMGDWGLAKRYLERVVGVAGNATAGGALDEATAARGNELLKLVKTKLQMRAASEAARLD